MTPFIYKFSTEFTDCPGGRYRARSDKSGEEFREDVLESLLREHEKVTLDLNGVYGFPPSFLDEAFGAVARRLGRKNLDDKIQIVIDDDPLAKRQLLAVIEKHAKQA